MHHLRLRRLSLGVIAALAALLIAGAGLATGYLTTDGQVRSGAERPDLVGALKGAPWLDQPGGSPSVATAAPRQSLRFPAGVTYQQALSQLYVSALERGDLPAGATLVKPLPAGTVLAGSPAEGITISLVAPFGYDQDTGAVRPPSYHLPGSLSPDEAGALVKQAYAAGVALPKGAEVDVPKLPGCQIAGAEVACAAVAGGAR